jgi:hypothetical protein
MKGPTTKITATATIIISIIICMHCLVKSAAAFTTRFLVTSSIRWQKQQQQQQAWRTITHHASSSFQEEEIDGADDDNNNMQEQDVEEQDDAVYLASLGFSSDPSSSSRNSINDALLEYSIDSFLRGDYDRPFSDDAAAPLPGLSPKDTMQQALTSMRHLDEPEQSHGAACFLRFCAPLSRGERWGGSTANTSPWKELLRGSLTPTMFARRLRASEEFSCLLDWEKLDLTDGAVGGKADLLDGLGSVAFVNAAFYFGSDKTSGPEIIQFKLTRIAGVWLIDSAQRCPTTLYQESSGKKKNGKK